MSVQILCYFYNLTLIFIYYFPVSRVLKISKDWLKYATVISKKKKKTGENIIHLQFHSFFRLRYIWWILKQNSKEIRSDSLCFNICFISVTVTIHCSRSILLNSIKWALSPLWSVNMWWKFFLRMQRKFHFFYDGRKTI